MLHRFYLLLFIVLPFVIKNRWLLDISALDNLIRAILLKRLGIIGAIEINNGEKNDSIALIKEAINNILGLNLDSTPKIDQEIFYNIKTHITDDPKSKEFLENYFSCRYFIDAKCKSISNSKKNKSNRNYKNILSQVFSKYELSEKQVLAIDDLNIEIQVIKEQQEFKKLKKELKKQLNGLNISLREAYSKKVDILKINYSLFFSVFSALTILSGFFYYSLVLNAIGLDAAKYFSISDYITGSISQIRNSIWGAVLALIGQVFIFRNQSNILDWKHRDNYRFNIKPLIELDLVLVIVLVIGNLKGATFLFSSSIIIIILTSLALVISHKLSKTFFKDYRSAYMTISFILIYFIYLGVKTSKDINLIRNGDYKAKEEIVLNDPKLINTSHCVLITSNSNYIFLRDTVSDQSYVLSRQEIRLIKTND